MSVPDPGSAGPARSIMEPDWSRAVDRLQGGDEIRMEGRAIGLVRHPEVGTDEQALVAVVGEHALELPRVGVGDLFDIPGLQLAEPVRHIPANPLIEQVRGPPSDRSGRGTDPPGQLHTVDQTLLAGELPERLGLDRADGLPSDGHPIRP